MALPFGTAVMQIEAADDQLKADLTRAESLITQSVGTMQAKLSQVAVSSGKVGAGFVNIADAGATASSAVGTLTGALSVVPIAGGQTVAILLAVSLQLRALVISTAAANAGITGLATALKAAFIPLLPVLIPVAAVLGAILAILSPYILAWKLASIAMDEANEALEKTEKRLADVNDRLERQTKLRREIDALRGFDVELATSSGVERGLILEKRNLEREIETSKLRQLRAIEAINRQELAHKAAIEGRIQAESDAAQVMADQQKILTAQTIERVRQKEQTIAQFGPQNAGQASRVIELARAAFEKTERGLFELRRAVLSQLSRGLVTDQLARQLLGGLPGEGGANEGTVGNARLVSAGAFSAGTLASVNLSSANATGRGAVGRDNKRNQLLQESVTAQRETTVAVKAQGQNQTVGS